MPTRQLGARCPPAGPTTVARGAGARPVPNRLLPPRSPTRGPSARPPTQVDISDEFRRVIESLQGYDDKVSAHRGLLVHAIPCRRCVISVASS
eukprot:scaffold218995_cov19-Tisochrysis_lutea.AAC.1